MRKFLLISVTAALAAFVFMPAGSASAASGNADQRVIVELALPASASADQIAAAADAVLAELPTGSYSVTNRYSTIPYLGLTVAPDALSILNTSVNVVAVHRADVVVALPSTPTTAGAGAEEKQTKKTKKCKKSKTKAGKKKYKACKKAAKQ